MRLSTSDSFCSDIVIPNASHAMSSGWNLSMLISYFNSFERFQHDVTTTALHSRLVSLLRRIDPRIGSRISADPDPPCRATVGALRSGSGDECLSGNDSAERQVTLRRVLRRRLLADPLGL